MRLGVLVFSVIIASYAPVRAECATAEAVIDAVYAQVLERQRDPQHRRRDGGASVTQLVDGRSTRKIIRAIVVESREYRNRFVRGKSNQEVVTKLYQHLLGRPPDDSGLAAWSAELKRNSNKDFARVVDGIMGSAEYMQNIGEWGVPGTRDADGHPIHPCIHHESIECGTVNITRASASCDATQEHAKCECNIGIVQWPSCTCKAGRPRSGSCWGGSCPRPPPRPAPAPTPPPAGAPTPPAFDASRCQVGGSARSTIMLTNEVWASLNLEVRVGNEADRERMTPCLRTELGKDQSVTVYTAGEDICWRRDADPDRPDGRYEAWNCKGPIGKGSSYRVMVR